MRRQTRLSLVIAMLGASGVCHAAGYSVSYDPYGTVDWATTLRCQSQHHEHLTTADRVTALSNAGYCAVTFMDYSGAIHPTYGLTTSPDPGVSTGSWGDLVRKWPPEGFGAPEVPLNSLRFYLPGAEEVGLVGGFYPTPRTILHLQSFGLTEYVEGAGCEACGTVGQPVHQNPHDLPSTHVYSSTQDAIAKMTALGALVTVAHPAGAPDSLDYIDPPPHSIEVYNNYHALTDEGTSGTDYIRQFRLVWDHLLEFRSSRVWGVAVNDWAGAWTPLGTPSVPGWPQITERNRDRGKLEVLVTSYDLEAYTNAFRDGAFFAIVEDNAIKSAYPVVSDIAVTSSGVAITTAAGTETVQWIGNGVVVGLGPTLPLEDLPEGLKYVRAEIDDGDGRTVFTQPFSLAAVVPPPPPAAPVPTLSEGALVFLGIALLAMGRRSRGAARA